MAAESQPSRNPCANESHVPWKDPKFFNGVDRVRKACNVPDSDREDDAMIGMLLDRFKWDHDKVVEMYTKSMNRRAELGMSEIKEHIVSHKLKLEDFPHHTDVGTVIPIFASISLERQTPAPAKTSPPGTDANTSASSPASPVIGCYEMRYGQGQDQDEPESLRVTPADFTKYMLYVTQWRWIQCENYARQHGELGFWSMVHDLSCPQGFLSVWSKARKVINNYISPVEEACSGLFPPMVQKILIVNVPRFFSPIWSIISMMLPEQHKERIVLLSTSKTTAAELSKYMPEKHLPPHVREQSDSLPPAIDVPPAADLPPSKAG
mmetsp:Transcript_19607/g.32688  ORF Transcript_19607/g.32688 Transcript_19607/m.32688 type:complete len:322 (+) Transcript_19607:112-1077(+)